jgi:ribulose-5-phosphate 4-epimerase/fuculose-1-phosphate aldolase
MKKVKDSIRRTRGAPRRQVFSRAEDEDRFTRMSEALAESGRAFYARGWALGTSGNFSAVVSRDPLQLAITSTGLDKGTLTAGQFLKISGACEVVRGDGKPSAEALLHVTVVRELNAGAVLHTHSVWSTVLSGLHAAEAGIALEGYEMLKGLEGVRTQAPGMAADPGEFAGYGRTGRKSIGHSATNAHNPWLFATRTWALYLGS